MASIWDAEKIEDYLIQLVKTDLPGKITAINLEKNDSVTVEQIPEVAFYSTFDESENNYDPILFYGYETIDTEGIGPATKKTFLFRCLVFITGMNNAQDDDHVNRKKSFRYSRIITEIFQSHSGDFGMFNNFEIAEYSPSDFSLNQTSPLVKVSGCEIIGNYF